MNLKKFTLLLFVVLPCLSFSQDTTKVKKNMIGFNSTPALIALLNSSPNDIAVSSTYKRLTSFGAFRSSARLVFQSSSGFRDLDRITDINDSTYTIRTERLEYRPTTQLRIGVEKHYRKKENSHWFFGADLLLSRSQSKRTESERTYNLDSAQSSTSYRPKPGKTVTAETNAIGLGITPFLGFHADLSNRFSMEIQTGILMQYGFGTSGSIAQDFSIRTNKVTVIDFSSFGNLTELNIYYRF